MAQDLGCRPKVLGFLPVASGLGRSRKWGDFPQGAWMERRHWGRVFQPALVGCPLQEPSACRETVTCQKTVDANV